MTKELPLDPYGHGELASIRKAPPAASSHVANSQVDYFLLDGIEVYWLHPAHDGADSYELWVEARDDINAKIPKVYCAVCYSPATVSTAREVADVMLRSLWDGRPLVAGALLKGFTESGLLTETRLAAILADYQAALEPPPVRSDGLSSEGELLHPDGKTRYRGEIRDGVPHGKGAVHREDGGIEVEGRFRFGKAHGKCRTYFSNGQLRYDGMLKNGLPEGRGREFRADGTLRFDGVFRKQSDMYGYGARRWLNGRLYDENGKLLHEGDFTDSTHSEPVRSRRKGSRAGDSAVARPSAFAAFFTRPRGATDARWRIRGSGVREHPDAAPTTARIIDACRELGIIVGQASWGSAANASSHYAIADFLDGGLRARTGDYWYQERAAWITGRKAVLLRALQLGLRVPGTWRKAYDLEEATLESLKAELRLVPQKEFGQSDFLGFRFTVDPRQEP